MATPQLATPDFYGSAPVHYKASHTVNATADRVFAALADAPNWPKWFPTISDAAWTSPAPHGVGSTRKVKVGPVWIHEEFIVWEPGRAWGFTFTQTTIPLVRQGAELVELEARGDDTHVTYNMFIDPFPGMGPISKALKGGVAKGLGDGLRGLEKYLAYRA